MAEQTHTQPAYLLLEDGTLIRGKALGKIGTTAGEICFNTGMTGYQEVFTDPSYFGQVLIMNNCYIGNYGTIPDDTESDGIKISGLVCKNASAGYSRKAADASLDNYLKAGGVVAICEVDTRALVTHIRGKGAMNCVISSEKLSENELRERLKQIPAMEGSEMASLVTTPAAYTYGNPDGEFRIAVLDLGVKKNILRSLAARGAFLKVFPARSSMAEMMTFRPDAFFISNGPGDPAAMDYAVETMRQIQNSDKPMFGICLGHQLLALANNAKTFKMHHGHRGLNHPVLNKITGLSEITTQNHGFNVDPESVKNSNTLEVTHINLNDGSIEGLRVKNKRIFSVQFHPESNPGTHDSRYLFDSFINNIRQSKQLHPAH